MSLEEINIEEFNRIAHMQLVLPFEQYGKELKGAVNTITETIKQVISNGYNFCNTSVNIMKKVSHTYMKESDDMDNAYVRTTEDSTVYPEANDVQKWLIETIKKITEFKPLNPQAIENMKKKGIEPKKQAGEILLFLIVCSRTNIHVAIYSPNDMNIIEFINSTLGRQESLEIEGKYGFVNFTDPSPIKKRDDVLQLFFTKLKEMGIYVVEKDDEN